MSERRFVVVGAGLSGCAVAHALATRGAQVDVLERAVPGAEASSAAAGILAPRMEAHGHEPLRSLGIASLGMYPEWLAALERDSGLTADFSRPGLLRVVGEQADPAEMKPDREAVWLEGAVLHRRESSLASPWAAAWWLPDECAVDPRKLMRAVHAAAAGAGARFHTGMTVDRVDADGVTGTSGERFRGVVVVCAGAWTGRIPGLAHVPVRPVRGQLVALQGGIGPRHVLFGPAERTHDWQLRDWPPRCYSSRDVLRRRVRHHPGSGPPVVRAAPSARRAGGGAGTDPGDASPVP